jgi:hypothetical protein
MILQSTPVLYVDAIEPSEAFFAKLGFVRQVAVPDTGELGFVILTMGGDGGVSNTGISVMLQTVKSGTEDMASIDAGVFQSNKTFLFMSVADVDAAAKALGDATLFLPRRDTFYGSTEIGFTEPGGHHVVLAQFAANSPDEA